MANSESPEGVFQSLIQGPDQLDRAAGLRDGERSNPARQSRKRWAMRRPGVPGATASAPQLPVNQ